MPLYVVVVKPADSASYEARAVQDEKELVRLVRQPQGYAVVQAYVAFTRADQEGIAAVVNALQGKAIPVTVLEQRIALAVPEAQRLYWG